MISADLGVDALWPVAGWLMVIIHLETPVKVGVLVWQKASSLIQMAALWGIVSINRLQFVWLDVIVMNNVG